MKQWQYIPEDGDNAISEIGTDEVVLYTNDVHPEVIAQIVQMHNEEYSLKKIKSYLESEERVTPDEIEFLMDELEKYEEMEKEMEQTAPMKEAPFPLNLEVDPVKQIDKMVAKKQEEMKPLTAEQTAQILTAMTDTQIQQEGQSIVSKRGKRDTDGTTGKKKMSLEDMIQEMESKIELAKVFQNIPEILFPENMSKSARDLMLKFQKEYKELVEKFIVEIQEM